MDKIFKWSETAEGDVYLDPHSDPDIQNYLKNQQINKSSGVTWDISKILQKVPYSGSSTHLEMLELEENMKNLIKENKYGYKTIENYLISLGYNLNKIRRVFKKLTGVDPDVYLDHQAYLNTPPSIPGINYGWGESKDKSYDYLFIMPWNNFYCIFGQKGDLEREIVNQYSDLESAKQDLIKKVKVLNQYDRVLSEKDLIQQNRIFTPEDVPMGTKVATQDNMLKTLQNQQDFLQETPQEFLDEVKTNDTIILDAINEISKFLDEVRENIPSYTITLRGFKFVTKEGGSIEITPSVKGVDVETSTFEAPVVFSVILEFNKDNISKRGLVIFLLKDNELTTNGMFKGEDKKIYALSEEGLNNYFNL